MTRYSTSCVLAHQVLTARLCPSPLDTPQHRKLTGCASPCRGITPVACFTVQCIQHLSHDLLDITVNEQAYSKWLLGSQHIPHGHSGLSHTTACWQEALQR
jgi:hypothetical protein